ncbi:thioredoxin domain-containing protein [Brachybacterium sp. MASK1Z-5]|uniref:Thioredoxin domain-containing protein n=1 Tax=Brachybacterium halotolerans TaxID=2795215 RepID=A0ABS1BEC7_9MICO|nr:thioredoxin domain-containing protein [Brachybacterium halotolerans]MBK0332502.1 thioredoxin domain-containing protein [Brachybacterium halotolerans]
MAASNAQDRREAQREAIRQQRQAELKRQRNVRTAVIAAVVVVVLLIAGGVGYLVWNATRPEGPVATPQGIPEGQPYYSLGAPEDSGKPVVELHVDFMCPICGQFEETNGKDLRTIIDKKEATVHLYTRRFLDGNSTTGDYSTRAANAAACVYNDDPDNFMDFQTALFDNQPAEGSAGLSDDQLAEYAKKAGASDSVSSCIDKSTYKSWVRNVVEPAAKKDADGGGTPYVKVDDTVLDSTKWSQEGVFLKTVEDAAKD